MSISTSALSWSSLVTAMRYAAASPGCDPSAALQLDDAIRQQSRPAAVRQHADPAARSSAGRSSQRSPSTAGAAESSRSQRA